eukprot:2252060-Prymnesium_polylepis.1
MLHAWRERRQQHHLGVATERLLQQPGQQRVTVRHVPGLPARLVARGQLPHTLVERGERRIDCLRLRNLLRVLPLLGAMRRPL